MFKDISIPINVDVSLDKIDNTGKNVSKSCNMECSFKVQQLLIYMQPKISKAYQNQRTFSYNNEIHSSSL